ncbi:Ankyrin repeat and fibronectin type-III domain-containing protein 1 [Nymphon striatum]|nr:Ankyrin repeat and fibronectin type-III domain-containing protein 1 [Nymphon striatum]
MISFLARKILFNGYNTYIDKPPFVTAVESTMRLNTQLKIANVNSDGFSPVDVATMMGSVRMVRLLQSHGAKSANSFCSKQRRLAQLVGLLDESDKKIEELRNIVNNNNLLPSNKENEKNLSIWEKRHALLKDMWATTQRMIIPNEPLSLTVLVLNSSTLRVKIEEPDSQEDGAIVTKYKIQDSHLKYTSDDDVDDDVDDVDDDDDFVRSWVDDIAKFDRDWVERAADRENWRSRREAFAQQWAIEWTTQANFSILTGDVELLDLRKLEYDVSGLTQGDRIYIRAAAGNIIGYSTFTLSCPTSAVPSVWRDVDGRKPRSSGRLSTLDDLFTQIRNTRTAHASEIKEISPDPQPAVQQRKTQVKKSIKSLFTGAPKFQKALSRGVYLACLLYTEDKILVSTEENIPTVEVDETYPSSLHTDILWMMKVACTWDDVKNLRQDMEKSHSSPTVHFRSKLLNAASQIQSALGIQDLGQFYHRPLKDNNGTIVMCTVRYIRDPKVLNTLAVKWVPLTKVQRKLSMFTTSGESMSSNQVINLGDILTSSIQDQLLYHQVSSIPLAKGLYLGYLKLKSSMDQIRLLVPHKTPNVLPHCRVRDNAHISSEEWEWLQTLQNLEKKSCLPSEAQLQFEQNIFTAAKRLFNHLCIDHDSALAHRVYTVEVIELSADVTFILILPSAEHVCSVPGNDDDLSSKPEFIMLPVQIFELAHMNTYNNNFLTRYARISSILEMDLLIAQHAQREAFSSDELNETKSRLTKLQGYQNQVDTIWKGMRWIMDVLSYARDKQACGGLCFNILYKRHQLLHPARAALIGHLRTPDTPPKPTSSRSVTSLNELSSDEKSKITLPSIQISSCPRNVSESSLCSISDPMMLHQQHTQIKKSNSVGSNFCVPECVMDHSRKSSISSCDSRTSCDSQRTEEEEDLGLTMRSSGSSSCKDLLSEHRLSVSSLEGSVRSLSSISSGEGLRAAGHPASRSQSNASLNSQQNIEPSSSKRSCFRDSALYAKSKSTESGSSDPEAYVFKRPHSAMSDQSNISSSSSKDVPLPDIVRVYAAYSCGLPCGTSVKLHITSRTTAREVVNLVVKQLNMAAVMKGKSGPIYSSQQLPNFCLVSVVGARERCLRDDFRPLQLQNPWTSGKLYVRMKNEVLAALEQNSSYSGRSSAYL